MSTPKHHLFQSRFPAYPNHPRKYQLIPLTPVVNLFYPFVPKSINQYRRRPVTYSTQFSHKYQPIPSTP